MTQWTKPLDAYPNKTLKWAIFRFKDTGKRFRCVAEYSEFAKIWVCRLTFEGFTTENRHLAPLEGPLLISDFEIPEMPEPTK